MFHKFSQIALLTTSKIQVKTYLTDYLKNTGMLLSVILKKYVEFSNTIFTVNSIRPGRNIWLRLNVFLLRFLDFQILKKPRVVFVRNENFVFHTSEVFLHFLANAYLCFRPIAGFA